MKKQLMGAAVASIVTIGAIGTIGAIQIQQETLTLTTLSTVSENKSKSPSTDENTVFVMSEYGTRVKLLIQTDTLLLDGGTLTTEVGGQTFTSTISGDKKPNEDATVDVGTQLKPDVVDSGYGISFERTTELGKLNTQAAVTPVVTYTAPVTDGSTNREEVKIKITSLTTVEVTVQNTNFDEKNISLDSADENNVVSFDNTADAEMVVYVQPSDGSKIDSVTYQINDGKVDGKVETITQAPGDVSAYAFTVPAKTKAGELIIEATQIETEGAKPKTKVQSVTYTLDPLALANVGATYTIETKTMALGKDGEDTQLIITPTITTDAVLETLTATINLYDETGAIATEVPDGYVLETELPTLDTPSSVATILEYKASSVPPEIFTDYTTTLTLDWTDETGHTIIEVNKDGSIVGESKDPDGLTGGAIAGIVIGSLAVVGLIAGGGYYFYTTKDTTTKDTKKTTTKDTTTKDTKKTTTKDATKKTTTKDATKKSS